MEISKEMEAIAEANAIREAHRLAVAKGIAPAMERLAGRVTPTTDPTTASPEDVAALFIVFCAYMDDRGFRGEVIRREREDDIAKASIGASRFFARSAI